MLRLLPSASVISGLPTQILPNLMTNRSMLWGMIAVSASLFSSTTSCIPRSMNVLNDWMLLSTKLCSSKYFLTRMLLSTDDHPVIHGLAGSHALPDDLDHIARFDVHGADGGIAFQNFWQLFVGDAVFCEKHSLLFLAELALFRHQHVFRYFKSHTCAKPPLTVLIR